MFAFLHPTAVGVGDHSVIIYFPGSTKSDLYIRNLCCTHLHSTFPRHILKISIIYSLLCYADMQNMDNSQI